MVKDGNNAAGSALSNNYPYDPALCPVPSTYCTAKTTSIGTLPTVSFTGSNSLGLSTLAIECREAMPNKSGIFFYSNSGPAANPFQGGFLCMNPPILRSPGFVFDMFGYISLPLPFTIFDVGNTRQYQFWLRDPQHPDGTKIGLSNGGQVTFCF